MINVRKMAAVLLSLFSFVLASSQASGSSASDIVGGWYGYNLGQAQSTLAFTFMNDGTYYLAEDGSSTLDSSGTSGMEYGTYAWNPTTGALTHGTTFDTNGQWGLSHSGTPSFSVSGNTLVIDGTLTLTRAVDASKAIVGSWYIGTGGQGNRIFTFLSDGTYLSAANEDPALDSSGQKGMERGTYTWDAATGVFTHATTVNTDGQWGLSHTICSNMQVSGNTLTGTCTDSPGTGDYPQVHHPILTRVTAASTPANPTGTHTASGTYTWNAATSVATFTWTASDFVGCDGPSIGTKTNTGVVITATTMTWATPDNMTWTRSGGTAGNIVGTWTYTDSTTGNVYTLIVNSDLTVSVSANIVTLSNCGGNGNQNLTANAMSQHWSNSYNIQLQYNDSPKTATAVSVAGPGITGSMALTYDTNSGSWASWASSSTNNIFWATLPTGLPYTYTFNITPATGTPTTATSTVSCFQELFATNLSPTGSVTGTGNPTFSWTGIADTSTTYQVQLNDSNNNQVWQSNNISGTSIVYNGPALTPGMAYNYNVVVNNSAACSSGASFAQGSFTYGSGTAAGYAGTYSGAYSGGDTGTWTATVSSSGAVTVTVNSNILGGSIGGSGQVSSNGGLTMTTTGSVSNVATFTGTINSTTGAVSGTWTGFTSLSGSFSGAVTPTGVSQFDGTYTGSWSDTCPTCGNTSAAGTFTATLVNGVFTNISLPVTSGNFGIRFDSGTVSSSGAITGTGATPSQCSSSPSTFTGQITGAGMTMTYSRPASGTCGAESGAITATRVNPTGTHAVSLSAASLTFATQNLGTISAAQTVTLTNSGNTTLNISSIAASGDYRRTTTCGATLAAGANCTISVSFTPATTGTRTGTVTIASNAAGSPHTVSLTGTAGATGTLSLTLPVAQGWNLLGNSLNQTLTVATLFGNSNVITVWKWDAAHSTWQFYAPPSQFSSGVDLASYAASHGYSVLTTINPGEGYWVNASGAFDLPVQSGTAYSLAAADLVGAWNLVATAADIDPRQLNAALNFFTLWAWSNPDGKWYFYAPFLDTGGTTLADYANRKHYLDFFTTGKTLGNGTGLWVNRP